MNNCVYRINYAIKSFDGWYFEYFDGNEFHFTAYIDKAKMWHEDNEPKKLLETRILGQDILPNCEIIKVKTEEYREEKADE